MNCDLQKRPIHAEIDYITYSHGNRSYSYEKFDKRHVCIWEHLQKRPIHRERSRKEAYANRKIYKKDLCIYKRIYLWQFLHCCRNINGGNYQRDLLIPNVTCKRDLFTWKQMISPTILVLYRNVNKRNYQRDLVFIPTVTYKRDLFMWKQIISPTILAVLQHCPETAPKIAPCAD